MKKDMAVRATIGSLLVLLGLSLAGRSLGLFNFNIFFNGWWTVFIIVPSALGLSDREHRTSSVIGLGIGIILLLSARGIFEWDMFFWVVAAFVFIVIGCSLIFKNNQNPNYAGYTDNPNYYQNNNDNNGNSNYSNSSNYENGSQDNSGYQNNDENNQSNGNQSNSDYGYGNQNSFNEDQFTGNTQYNGNSQFNGSFAGNSNFGTRSTNHSGNNHFTGILSGQTIQFVDEVFSGAVVSSILGSVQIDLRNAIFTGNAIIEASCILGGVDIFVPSNVKVVNNCSTILAGVDNKVVSPMNASGEIYTLIINGTCILGGIEVKY